MHYHQLDHSVDTLDYNSYLLWGDSLYGNIPLVMNGTTDDLSDMPDLYHCNGLPDIVQCSIVNISYPHNNEDCQRDSYDKDSWQCKPVKQWESIDIIHWINSEANNLDICCTDIGGPSFSKLDGVRLMEMTESDFEKCDSKYGLRLYKQLRNIISQQKYSSSQSMMPPDENSYEQTYTVLDSSTQSSKYKQAPQPAPSSKPLSHFTPDTDDNDNSSSSLDISDERLNKPALSINIIDNRRKTKVNCAPLEGERKKRVGPGRPKQPRKKNKKQEKKLGRLWEFIRDLLKNPEYCPSIICWEDHDQGMFRFVHSDRVAKLWGNKKGNDEMNYEKLSRAMRYYYKSKVLEAVLGRRLVYRFGPNAKNWRVDNPNFKN